MSLAHLITFLIFNVAYSDANITLNHNYNYSATTQCVKSIIKQRFELSVITFVNFNTRDIDILRNIHSMSSVLVINRKPFTKINLPNRGYLISALNAEEFVSKFPYLLSEHTWMPYAPFLIVVQFLQVPKLFDMFQELLRVHVTNAVVVDGSTISTYTYDPYENNGCGKRFNRIIELGKCLSEMPAEGLPKSKGIFENCTLNVAVTNWPPYAVDPKINSIKSMGIDEYLFSLLAKLEHFKVNVSYFDEISDEVTVVDDDMVASGPLSMLQSNEYDVVTGSIVLILNRATAFTFLYGHTAYADDFRIIVPKAVIVPMWRMLYLEFSPLVWILLLLTFGIVATLIILISKTADKSHVILNLWNILLQHTCRIRRTPKTELLLISWYIFACLITYLYLTSLFGLNAKPIYNYQIQTIEDLKKASLQPCISNAIRKFQTVESALDVLGIENITEQVPRCERVIQSLETVSKTHDMYTILPYSVYYSNRYRYYDENGVQKIYSFPQPLSKIIYASFLFKGFPLYDKFHQATLWVRSAGLISKTWEDYEYQQKKQTLIPKKTSTQHFVIPVYVIGYGWGVSSLCFIGEILAHKWKPNHILDV